MESTPREQARGRRKGPKMDAETMTCEWFALCTNEATGMYEHPILGAVPICQRCADKVDKLK